MTALPHTGLATSKPTSGTTTIVTLPGNEGEPGIQTLVKFTAAGAVQKMMTRVPLNEDLGHVYPMGGMKDGKWDSRASVIITAAGYDRLNQFGGISFSTPPSLPGPGGSMIPNPKIDLGDSGHIECVRVTMFGVGRNALGNMVAISKTIVYDLRTYLAQDLMSKWTGRKKDAPKDWAFLSPGGEDIPRRKDYPVQQAYSVPGGFYMVVNLAHKDVINLMAEHINRCKFAPRMAETICKRNILKQLFAASKLAPDLTVPVVGWVQRDEEVAGIGKAISESCDGKLDVDGTIIDVQASTDKPDLVETEAILHGSQDEDQHNPTDEPEPGSVEASATPAAATPEGLNASKAKLRELYQMVGPETFTSVLAEHGMSATDVTKWDKDTVDKAISILEGVVAGKDGAG